MIKKESIKFAFTMFTLTFGIAILILGICWIFYVSPFDFPGTVGEWITAFSALAGGAMTLGGVWWTIKDHEKEKTKELEILYRPILRVISPENKDEQQIIIKKDNQYLYLNVLVYIENIGRGEAINVKPSWHKGDISKERLPYLNNSGSITAISDFKEILLSSDNITCLPINNKTDIMIQILLNKSYEKYDVFYFYIDFEFKNLFSNKKTYTHSAKIVIRNNESLDFEYNGKYSAIIFNHYQ